ncbi:MAG: SDR family oxidoreductase [Alphaproteobacteria bacterium]|nr:MAG: SDR family oxidoreductase [Alphaproteobacteria bacterium]
MPDINLSGRAIIVTGASRGMGREMADALLAAGASVAVLSPEADELEATAAELGAAHGRHRVIALVSDITDYHGCARGVAETVAAFGGLDGLVNHAGIGPLQVAPTVSESEHVPFWIADPARWARLIEVNMIGTYFMARAAAPVMIQRGWGRIVNVTTSLPNYGRGHWSPYGCSKAGVESETLIFAQDLEGTGVTCNAFFPGGAVRTKFVPQNMHSSPRLLDADIMRKPIVWLMSDHSGKHNGERFNARYWDAAADAGEAAAQAVTVPAYRAPPPRANLGKEEGA